jgi:vacuolar protein sorting-associated protein 29
MAVAIVNMSQFGELVLVIGDLHIPQRGIDIPEQFREMLVPGKVQHVLCTGNVGNRETTDWVKSLAPNVHFVKGDFDDGSSFPESKSVTLGDWKVSLVHGHQIIPWGDTEALANYQRLNDCDILVHGHSHKLNIQTLYGKYFVNPGSVTGAYSSLTSDVSPSFLLMAFQGNEITAYVYEIKDGELSINKVQLSKN